MTHNKYNFNALFEWQKTIIRNSIWRDWRFMLIFWISLALNIIIWYLWQTKILIIGPFYNPFAHEFLGTFNLSLPLLAMILIILNLVLAVFSWKREKLASFILISIGLFVQILVLILFYYFLKGM